MSVTSVGGVPLDQLMLTEDPSSAMIVQFLQRAQSIRNQIRAAVAHVMDRTREANRYQEALELLQGLRMAGMARDGDGTVGTGPHSRDRMPGGGEGSTNRAYNRLKNEFGIELAREGTLVKRETLEEAIQMVQSRLQRLNSTSELEMLNIQTLMESQANMFRMTSQIMAGQHDVGKSIITNMST